MAAEPRSFPPFDLVRLLRTVFAPRPGERVALLIDLDDPRDMEGSRFLRQEGLPVQKLAHEAFYQRLREGGLEALGWEGGEIFAYRTTGGSNLDLPRELFDAAGRRLAFETDIYPRYDILLCLSTYSATAPLTAAAKRFGFRGATLHGLNPAILASGLAVDYEQVSRQAEAMRRALDRADGFRVDFALDGREFSLALECGRQEAQKSHGLCRGPEPDVANLPAGEVYYVPTGAEGSFPSRYSEGTLAEMRVAGGRILEARWLEGDPRRVEEHNRMLGEDPATGELGELGFGTQELPVSGSDIQDEKILGTMHLATGRSDHLGGHLTPDRFADPLHATHDDILFSPSKTPGIRIPRVVMRRDGKEITVLEDYQPALPLREALGR